MRTSTLFYQEKNTPTTADRNPWLRSTLVPIVRKKIAKALESPTSPKHVSEEYGHRIKDELRSMYTIEQWMSMGSRERRTKRVQIGTQQLGLHAAASILGTSGDPINNYEDFKRIMAYVFDTDVDSHFKNCIREAVQNMHSLEQWMSMGSRERRTKQVQVGTQPIGLFAIAGILGSGGSPINNSNDFKRLMASVFGSAALESYAEIITPSKIVSAIKNLYPLERWMSLTGRERKKEKITIWMQKIGLYAIGSMLWCGDPVNNAKNFRKLLERVYGEEILGH